MVPSIKFILVFLIMGMGGKGWGQTISWEHPGNITAWYSSGNWNPITSSIDWLPNNIAGIIKLGYIIKIGRASCRERV